MHSQLSLIKTIYTLDQLEVMPKPQIALAGRSNVGKSSLINCLAGRKGLAKTSSTPGKTRSLNFYLVQPEEFYLVDLPGYGYARCSKKEREKWARLIEQYFKNNEWLKAVVIIIDARLSPQAMDMELASYVQNIGFKLIPVLTKADKCKQKQKNSIQKTWQELLGLADPPLLFSSKTGQGKNKLWQTLKSTALQRL
ncbi:YihA family ribosome biogenesis GTP-binding protein [Desulfohalobiaceae bacterium Ax17]|jgi:GTP-binding protein|uniref:ribosome biogenesis GTP-binding protein YihA/YsxC n=1 Tax=Desulfovulcanus ferrireducens TaxID=2831190 RepID=UPI00207BC1E5|nr:ribosome biogenesis GTP-binding protein YihA/YsxC [Desulfovulcanus ferrireducens]MBT8762350.1 YihA family ribosome biogenesis GTP-binding protein [Desulfovulcanus ferrireducens]